MAKELLHGPKSLYRTSGNGTVEYFDEGVRITGNAWVNQYDVNQVASNYIEINPNATFKYDILYSNKTENNQIYIGFERFDENKSTISNNATVYIIANKTVCENKRIVGTVNLATLDGTTPTKYIRLRILNQWTGSSATNAILEIKVLSLLQINNITNANIQKTGIIVADNFRENNVQEAKIFKSEGIESNCFYEI